MNNNDEVAVYTNRELSHDDQLLKKFSRTRWDHPSLVISRPVYSIEGLAAKGIRFSQLTQSELFVVERRDIVYDAATPLLDSIYRLKAYLENRKVLYTVSNNPKAIDPTEVLSHYVAYGYYDCMSGGMPTWDVSIVRFVMENCPLINWDMEVYPGKGKEEDSWYTLRDFYNETNGSPELKQYIKKLPVSLPLLLEV